VRRLQSQGKSQSEAIELAESVDRDRATFIKDHFGIEWPARHFFHLMVNSTMGDEAAIQIIVTGLEAAQAAPSDDRPKEP
jgi:hypothetical protein